MGFSDDLLSGRYLALIDDVDIDKPLLLDVDIDSVLPGGCISDSDIRVILFGFGLFNQELGVHFLGFVFDELRLHILEHDLSLQLGSLATFCDKFLGMLLLLLVIFDLDGMLPELEL